MLTKKIILAMALVTVFSAPAIASTITTYANIASFDAATTGDTTIGFSGVAPNGYQADGSSLTTGGVTFTDNVPALAVIGSGFYTTPFTSDYLNNNVGGTSITIDFSSAVYGFALDFGTIYNWGDASSLTETFSFADASKTVNLPGMLSQSAPVSFIGFTSNTAFSQITITDPTEGLAIGDLTYTTNPAGATVPEPASLALLGLGFLGITTTRRRAKKQG